MNLRMVAFLAIKGIISEMNGRDQAARAVNVFRALDLTPDGANEVLWMVEELRETFLVYSREEDIFAVMVPALKAHIATI